MATAFGFLIVILGRQQLFTENTITVVIPLLHERTLATFGNVIRVWTIILLSNLVGGAMVALVGEVSARLRRDDEWFTIHALPIVNSM